MPADSARDVPDNPEDADDGWKFELDEVDEEGMVDDRDPIEPGSPTMENALFVLLGALVTVGIIVRVMMTLGA
ncbi:hypothetical protein G9464_07840 [Halostella sp. JP-L12]|uniref:DUF7312 domain-containing protein n=1 Tax=Halostella TaxID=1843185 RepID=UPI000EF83622|nr:MULTISPECIES: hypothetical protein [Halostella]NHN47505.1 hypothetical protein [Halostella sp. JP-L12]